jgi:esterase/lipase
MLSNDYNVFIPRLYGFGTKKEFFKKTYFTQWYRALEDTYREYRKKYDDVTVCGFSFGGMMTLRLAEDFCHSKDLAMKKIVVISAPVFLNNLGEGIIVNPFLYLARTISWFTSEIPAPAKPLVDNDGAVWLGYHEIMPKQIYSFEMGMRTTRRNLGRINIPVLLMHCRGDRTAPFENMDYIYNHISSKDKTKYEFRLDGWNHTKHLLPYYDSTYAAVYTNMIKFIGK